MKEDLSNTWNISIAVKIAAPILWLIIITSIVFSILWQQDSEKTIQFNMIHDADVLSHEVEELIENSLNPENNQNVYHIDLLLKQFHFNAVSFEINGHNAVIGEISEGDDYISRTVDITDKKTEIRIFHKPVAEQIIDERKKTLFAYGPVFIAFGLVFAWLIKFVVIRPLLELVEATQKISDGDINYRLSTQREDEFGTLAKFFNQMMDNLKDQQQKLEQTAVDEQQANRAKSSFLANMSHELRTPLNAIIGYSEILQQEAEQAGKQQTLKDLTNIHVSGKHLLSLIDDILDISRIEAGKIELYIEDESLELLLQNVMFTCKSLADKNHNQLILNCPDIKGVTIKTDITKLRQILLNLIGNACKFTENGKITLDVELNGNWIDYTVSDTGIGIDEKQMENIFHPFHQADSSTTRKYGGSGLGLAISHHYSEMMGGEIRVESKSQSGSRFKLHLPRIINK